MKISYKKIWILLIEKDISPATLRKDLNIASGTMTKMRRNEEVALSGDINLSGGEGSGFNMAALMASMAVGGVVGQNIAGSMNNMMSGINQIPQAGATPPPVPVTAYHVVVNGQAMGPYGLNDLSQMVIDGQFTTVWWGKWND